MALLVLLCWERRKSDMRAAADLRGGWWLEPLYFGDRELYALNVHGEYIE